MNGVIQQEGVIALPVTDIPSGDHIMQLQQKGKITFQTKLIPGLIGL